MERLTYDQAYSKIIDAYFKDEIRPTDAKFCFCGTLANGDGWTHKEINGYTGRHFKRMEAALLDAFGVVRPDGWSRFHQIEHGGNYEDVLFAGMSAALDVLKQIHIDRGEIIDEPQTQFKKRELA